eukprot:TRINITY_DN37928_c0_g1_i8.p2 TRINITY_DN37928_c0_g1~~TRINITY_DN37928_c0_g1_i8.p2  ORF type:complete len:121 (-),score=32.26 TRINITY_DN37928_c0_g1_i8:279-641(-)
MQLEAVVEAEIQQDVKQIKTQNQQNGLDDKTKFEMELMSKMEGGMKLSLTSSEASAKAEVQLPYEHGGKDRIFQSQDFKDYLPEAAGGKVNQTKLGQIHYLRDSEGEYDSGEDPDDDLDI